MDYVPLYIFVFVGLFSPGPNVILLTASGARFGVRASVPHIFGVACGVAITGGVTGLGLGSILAVMPALKLGLSVIAALWICYMAFQLWNAAPHKASSADRPFTFLQAVLFQWVNPKVWAVALAAVAYLPEVTPQMAALSMAYSFAGINLFVSVFWVNAGNLLALLLNRPAAHRIFMRVMAVFLAITAGVIFI